MDTYLTLAFEAAAELTEKKSVFIASTAPVSNENEAIAFIDKIKKSHPDAGHNVYAYRIGLVHVYEKYSDDGEPSGTAGVPALSVLKKENVTNAVVVVTRYFGGILLGAGGLVRAYLAACKAGVDAAGIVTKRLAQVLSVTVPYAVIGRLQRDAPAGGYEIVGASYAENAELIIRTPIANADAVIRRVADLSNGAAAVVKKDRVYV